MAEQGVQYTKGNLHPKLLHEDCCWFLLLVAVSVDRSAVVLLLQSMPMDVRRCSWLATTTLAHELAHQGSSQTADGRLLGAG